MINTKFNFYVTRSSIIENRDYFEKVKTWDFRVVRFAYDYGNNSMPSKLLNKKKNVKFRQYYYSGSVMHYPADAFAKNTSTPVIVPLRGKPIIGNRRHFSPVKFHIRYNV